MTATVPFQVFPAGDATAFVGGDGQLAGEVWVGEVIDFLAFVGDPHTSDHTVDLIGAQRLQGRVKAHRTELDLEALILGNRGHNIDVNTDQFAGRIPEFKGSEGRIRPDHVQFTSVVTGDLIVS